MDFYCSFPQANCDDPEYVNFVTKFHEFRTGAQLGKRVESGASSAEVVFAVVLFAAMLCIMHYIGKSIDVSKIYDEVRHLFEGPPPPPELSPPWMLLPEGHPMRPDTPMFAAQQQQHQQQQQMPFGNNCGPGVFFHQQQHFGCPPFGQGCHPPINNNWGTGCYAAPPHHCYQPQHMFGSHCCTNAPPMMMGCHQSYGNPQFGHPHNNGFHPGCAAWQQHGSNNNTSFQQPPQQFCGYY